MFKVLPQKNDNKESSGHKPASVHRVGSLCPPKGSSVQKHARTNRVLFQLASTLTSHSPRIFTQIFKKLDKLHATFGIFPNPLFASLNWCESLKKYSCVFLFLSSVFLKLLIVTEVESVKDICPLPVFNCEMVVFVKCLIVFVFNWKCK